MTFTHDSAGTPASEWSMALAQRDIERLSLDDGRVDTVVVVAAHPDDESLGAGGLMVAAHDRGLAVRLLVATAGEGSHPASRTMPPARLADLRRRELDAATSVLAPGTDPVLLGIADGEVDQHEPVLTERLVSMLGDARRTLVVAPWRHDGHPDHEAAGRAAAAAAARTGARLLEYPIWFWHWAEPGAAPWQRMRVLELDHEAVARKGRAISAHRSQTRSLSDLAGDEVLLGPRLLAHFGGESETYVEDGPDDPTLDLLHQEDADPWGVDTRWYEARKRALLLALLPRTSFRRGLEIGCSTGALSADLAGRCDRLVAIDASPRAVALAHDRLAQLEHVSVGQVSVPGAWPQDCGAGQVDLVVVSEVGYFLSPAALDALLDRIRVCLADDGVVVVCHWRHEVAGWVLDGPRVHALFTASLIRPVVAEYRDRDVEMLVLTGPELLPDPHE
ncbi:MAG: bifunctional PIG-L family deacetylase/class I SAM-dependent methyltransferase [Nocardioides sp.]